MQLRTGQVVTQVKVRSVQVAANVMLLLLKVRQTGHQ